LTYPKST